MQTTACKHLNMKPILITALLFATSLAGYTQPRTLRATDDIKEKSVVIYINNACTIVFLKGELSNAFSNDMTSSWFKMKFPEQRQAALRAVALLKKDGPLTLKTGNAKASADEKELASLIEERLAAGPFMIGNVNVFDKNKVRQDTIEVVNHRKFYFRKSATPFFEIPDE
jgi:hypothetical protein